MANQWFRMYHEFATDPKVQMLSESDQRRYVMVLCLRCCNDNVTLHDEEVAFQLRISNEEWCKTKRIFIEKNLITTDNKPTSWDKRQFASDTSNNRVAAFRERKKALKSSECINTNKINDLSNSDVTLQERFCNFIDTDTDTDTDIKESTKEKKSAKKDELTILSDYGITGDLANDFLQIRKTKKAPVTKTSMDGIQREAEKAKLTIQEAVKVSTENNWQGFKASWYANLSSSNIAKTVNNLSQDNSDAYFSGRKVYR